MVKDPSLRGHNETGIINNHSPPPTRKPNKKLPVGFIWNWNWNCTMELKFLLTALFILCFLATFLQFIPLRHPFSLSSSCIAAAAASIRVPPHLQPKPDQVLHNGVLRRSFSPHGSAAYSFILMSAYRGGDTTFAVLGLSFKPLHVFGRPNYTCIYYDPTATSTTAVAGAKILPDSGNGRVYTVVIVNCTFPHPVGTNGGGRLVLNAFTNGGDRDLNLIDTIEALVEPPGSVDLSTFSSPPKLDYLYCSPSLYGDLSPQRVREWIAYHARLFGAKSRFVIYDAGGVHPQVMEVLRPWMEMGYVNLQDIREQERFDGYHHNQFLAVNDCLHRYRFSAKWMFFFDLDEYVFVPGRSSLRSLMDSLKGYSQFTIEQVTMSGRLCLTQDAGKTPKKWGFEKLVYRDARTGINREGKYAIQPRSVFATGVNMSQNLQGLTLHKTSSRIKYFHYHGTLVWRREPCRRLINDTEITVDGIPYVVDTTMRDVVPLVKRFELNNVGQRLNSTRQ